jgi:hypothetical protein
MARKVLVRLVDDLDGLPGEDVATVTFSLDGVTFQIDLNESNAGKLRDGLSAFVAAGRRTGGRVKRGTAARVRGTGNDGPAIRAWARTQGHDLAERGRIPAHIVDAYQAAAKSGRAKPEAVTATVAPRTRKPAVTRQAKTAAASRTAPKATATATGKPKTATRTTKAAAAKTAKATTTRTTTTRTTKAATAKAATAKAAPKATAKTAAKAPKAAPKAPRAATRGRGASKGR